MSPRLVLSLPMERGRVNIMQSRQSILNTIVYPIAEDIQKSSSPTRPRWVLDTWASWDLGLATLARRCEA